MKTSTQIKVIAIIVGILLLFTGRAQCPNNNTQYGSINNLSPGQTATVYCMYGGEYATVQVQNGSTYTFSTCGGSWDSQLSLYTNNGAYLAYNDDYCGLQSQITWTANFSGIVRVVLDRYYCTSYSSCMNLNVTRSSSTPSNPCDNKIVADCGNTYNYNLGAGSGSWNPTTGPWGTPGNEQVYEFTAVNTGLHTITMNNSNSGWVDLFIQANNCGANGWTYVDDIYTSGTNYITLNAGTTYYLLVDDENTSASSGTIQIDCPSPAANPCNNITDLSCGVTEYFNLNGSGAWNPPGPWGTPGEESVYSFTPAVSGNYDVNVTNSGYYVDLFYKSSACGPNGWTYVDDIYSSSTNSIYLSAGTTYYFLIDDENISSSSGSISIDCPCIGNLIDNSISLNANQTIYGNTIGACDDCGLRSSEDITYEVVIPCAGTYTFETCNLASWDTYLYLSTSPCSGVLASNDDNCGLRSSITYTFGSSGTYYVTIEGFSLSSAGAYGLAISRTCELAATLSSPDKGCGYNLSCSNSNDGEVFVNLSGSCGTVNYTWSNGSTGASISGLSAGIYALTVEDQWGCIASDDISLTAPPAITVSAGSDQTVYYGYTPLSCADLNGSASGGCGSLSYEWTESGTVFDNNSSTNVCPSSATTYQLTATDANGCQNTDDVHVCVVDVVCYAGNSNVQKVEICHTPPGNSGNAHTICVSENAVQDHLDHGCQLGACGEAYQSCNVSSTNSISSGVSNGSSNILSGSVEMVAYPNPFNQQFTFDLDSDEAGFYQINLIDITGKSVMEIYEGYNEGLSQSFKINSKELSPGIYLIKVNVNNMFIGQERIIKQ